MMKRDFGRLLCVVAAAALAGWLCACRVDVEKSADGHDKNVKIDTPFGGVHVNADAVSAADTGLPLYPGAKLDQDHDGDNKSADIHMGFGDWQMRLKVVSYRSNDSQDKVVAFYRKALGRYGDVIECNGKTPVGMPNVTREGLTCDDTQGVHGRTHIAAGDDGSGLSLKAGSKRHQHIVGIDSKSGDDFTKFGLVELDLPGSSSGDVSN
ncbi:MAG TPA: hypothetical protein VGD59_06440 [Acidisarcina sp.]